KLKELKPFLKKEYGVKEIGVFGSFADNTATDASDIDILIALERPIGWRFFGLGIFLEKTFGRKVDLVTRNALKEQLRSAILGSVIPVE
ncbi:MAG: nucleotidyltransferase family protein, partial [Flavobacteriales bacterium]|nr:nucleotidyltransferase family protein [Flavobacteriales bacterium]